MTDDTNFERRAKDGLELVEPEIEERRADPALLRRARAQYAAGVAVPGEAVFEWLASWGSAYELPPPRRGAKQP